MKARVLSFLAAVAAVLTAVSSADLSGLIAVLPPEVAKGLAVGLPALAAIAHFLKSVTGTDAGTKLKVVALMFVPAFVALLVSSCSIAVDPASGRLVIAADATAVGRFVEEVTRKANEKLEAIPAVPIAEK